MKNVKGEIDKLRENLPNLFVIHYSCENLGDSNQGLSPRITSIAVQHFSSKMMHSFSIHLLAEKKGIARDQIQTQYDNLEKEMLIEFFKFSKDHPDAIWIHWNMSNINFGFEALEHRYEVLTKKEPPKIQDVRRRNLSSLITYRYGKNCVDHPRMEKLMELNGGISRDFLSGASEVTAFQSKEYIKLHKSTMSKVYWFTEMLDLLLNGRIVTQRSNWVEKINVVLESKTAKIIGVVSSLAGLIQLVASLF